MGEYERVREQLLEFDGTQCATCPYKPCPVNEKSKMLCPAEVDYILSLVEIRADDQTAPSSFDYDEDYDTEDAYGLGRSDIIKAGFVKVAPKPNV